MKKKFIILLFFCLLLFSIYPKKNINFAVNDSFFIQRAKKIIQNNKYDYDTIKISEIKKIKIIEVKEKCKFFILKGIDLEKDTVSIIVKKEIGDSIYYIGTEYEFELRKRNPYYLNNLTIKICDSIIWQPKDDYKKMPYFGKCK
jgi:hypothetical protein